MHPGSASTSSTVLSSSSSSSSSTSNSYKRPSKLVRVELKASLGRTAPIPQQKASSKPPRPRIPLKQSSTNQNSTSLFVSETSSSSKSDTDLRRPPILRPPIPLKSPSPSSSSSSSWVDSRKHRSYNERNHLLDEYRNSGFPYQRKYHEAAVQVLEKQRPVVDRATIQDLFTQYQLMHLNGKDEKGQETLDIQFLRYTGSQDLNQSRGTLIAIKRPQRDKKGNLVASSLFAPSGLFPKEIGKGVYGQVWRYEAIPHLVEKSMTEWRSVRELLIHSHLWNLAKKGLVSNEHEYGIQPLRLAGVSYQTYYPRPAALLDFAKARTMLDKFIETDSQARQVMRKDVFQAVKYVQLIKMAFQITKGCVVCQSLGFLHMDLKPQNVLVDYVSGVAESYRLNDFGMMLPVVPFPSLRPSTTMVSLFFRAPELLYMDYHLEQQKTNNDTLASNYKFFSWDMTAEQRSKHVVWSLATTMMYCMFPSWAHTLRIANVNHKSIGTSACDMLTILQSQSNVSTEGDFETLIWSSSSKSSPSLMDCKEVLEDVKMWESAQPGEHWDALWNWLRNCTRFNIHERSSLQDALADKVFKSFAKADPDVSQSRFKPFMSSVLPAFEPIDWSSSIAESYLPLWKDFGFRLVCHATFSWLAKTLLATLYVSLIQRLIRSGWGAWWSSEERKTNKKQLSVLVCWMESFVLCLGAILLPNEIFVLLDQQWQLCFHRFLSHMPEAFQHWVWDQSSWFVHHPVMTAFMASRTKTSQWIEWWVSLDVEQQCSALDRLVTYTGEPDQFCSGVPSSTSTSFSSTTRTPLQLVYDSFARVRVTRMDSTSFTSTTPLDDEETKGSNTRKFHYQSIRESFVSRFQTLISDKASNTICTKQCLQMLQKMDLFVEKQPKVFRVNEAKDSAKTRVLMMRSVMDNYFFSTFATPFGLSREDESEAAIKAAKSELIDLHVFDENTQRIAVNAHYPSVWIEFAYPLSDLEFIGWKSKR